MTTRFPIFKRAYRMQLLLKYPISPVLNNLKLAQNPAGMIYLFNIFFYQINRSTFKYVKQGSRGNLSYLSVIIEPLPADPFESPYHLPHCNKLKTEHYER